MRRSGSFCRGEDGSASHGIETWIDISLVFLVGQSGSEGRSAGRRAVFRRRSAGPRSGAVAQPEIFLDGGIGEALARRWPVCVDLGPVPAAVLAAPADPLLARRLLTNRVQRVLGAGWRLQHAHRLRD